MKAKDTVMTIGAIVVNLKWGEAWIKDHRKGLEKLVNEQAEISFKAGYHQREIDPLDKEDRCEKCYKQGIKEVVDWIGGFDKPFPTQREWKVKLKEWGIKED